MCSISGIYSNKLFYESHEQWVKDSIGHFSSISRGPDNTGYLTGENVIFGHNRLSIIDLTAGGDQPMVSSSGRYIITYNGEIYNYKELKEDLVNVGVQFVTESDTEVLLEGIELWGIKEILEKVQGMFAFALYDKVKNELTIARDIFGKKPFYYELSEDEFKFSSSVGVFDIDDKHIDKESLHYYLLTSTIPGDRTINKKVKKLMPGTFAVINSSLKIEFFKYFSIDRTQKKQKVKNVLKKTELLLIEAIEKRLRSDVPLGAFLSGGVDSSLLVSLISKKIGLKLKTFSIGFNHPEYDESTFAREVAKKYNTDHYELILDDIYLKDLVKIISFYGEPFADSSQIPSFYVANLASKHVKVVISGDGGDESFAGYSHYYAHYIGDIFSKTKLKVFRPILGVLGRYSSKIRTVYNYSASSFIDRIFHKYEDLEKILLSNYLSNNEYSYKSYLEKIQQDDGCNGVNSQIFDFKTRFVDDYLVKVDWSGMMNSIEIRSPFLDRKLVEYSFTIPFKLKVFRGELKYILKKISEKYLTRKLIYRKKMGFRIPLKELFEGDLGIIYSKVVLCEKSYSKSIFSESFLNNLLQTHKLKLVNNSSLMWNLLVLEIWYNVYVTKKWNSEKNLEDFLC